MKVTIPAKTIEINRCYHECPHFGLSGYPGPIMVCDHPFWKDHEDPYDACIISHPECDNGFPSRCPLFKENGIEPPPLPKKIKSNSDYLTKEEQETLSAGEQFNLIFERRMAEELKENS